MTLIRIGVPPQAYDVIVGPLDHAIERIRDIAGPSKRILVSDPKVFGLVGGAVAEALRADPILVPEGEAAKDWQQLHLLLAAMARLGGTRHTLIVGLGGGSVGDVAGLAAALFKGGCPVIHIPTTLLAQADSAIDGKAAIDAFGEKNLIGTFYQPALVIADPSLLDTLDERQLLSGYAEVVKYGLIDDPAFFAWCEANGRGLLAGHPDLRRHAITTAIQSKARIVGADLMDRSGKRALHNLGHSFGHAIEAEAGPGHVLHGEAVALGLSLAFRYSADCRICPKSDADRVTSHLAACGLPTRLADVGLAGSTARFVSQMGCDKKNMEGRLALILARGIGKAFFEANVDARRLADFLDRAG